MSGLPSGAHWPLHAEPGDGVLNSLGDDESEHADGRYTVTITGGTSTDTTTVAPRMVGDGRSTASSIIPLQIRPSRS